MTCVVGLVHKNVVYIGADSMGSCNEFKTNRRTTKVFKKCGMVIGYTSSFRMGDILKYHLEIPNIKSKQDEEEYMVKEFIPAVVHCMEKNNWVLKQDERISGGTFIVGINKRLFTIYDDFQVEELVDKYAAIGSGRDLAIGAMAAFENSKLSPEEKIMSAIKIASRFNPFVGGEINIVTVGTLDRETK